MKGPLIFIISSLLCLIANDADVVMGQAPNSHSTFIQKGTDSDDLTEATRLSAVVVKLVKEGRYDEALPLASKALAIREKLLGPEHEYVADSLINLSEIYIAKQRYSEAEALLQRLLKITEKRFGADSLRTGKVLDRLGLVEFWRKELTEAERSLTRALTIKEKIVSADDVELAQTLFSLAEYHAKQRSYKQAAPFYRRAIAIWEKTLDKTSLNLNKVVDRYICYLEEYDQLEELKNFLNGRRVYRIGDMTLTGGVIYGEVMHRKLPPYHRLVDNTYITYGKTAVRVLVDEAGVVIKAEMLCGLVNEIDRQLVELSLDKAMKERFQLTPGSGEPAKTSSIIIYQFGAPGLTPIP